MSFVRVITNLRWSDSLVMTFDFKKCFQSFGLMINMHRQSQFYLDVTHSLQKWSPAHSSLHFLKNQTLESCLSAEKWVY